MPASFRVLLLCGSSRALLPLLSGLLPSGGFSGGALLGLLGSAGLLSCGSVRRRALLRLLPSGGFGGGALLGLLGSAGLLSCGSVRHRALLRLLPGSGFSGGALLRLLGSAGLQSCGSFRRCVLLRLLIRRWWWSRSRVRTRRRMGNRRR